jgi:hypothetical protein
VQINQEIYPMTKVTGEDSTAAGTAAGTDTSSTDDTTLKDDDDLEDFEDTSWDDGEDDGSDEAVDSDTAATEEEDADSEESDDDADESESEQSEEDVDLEDKADSTTADKKSVKEELAERQRKNQEAAARRVEAKKQREDAKATAQADYVAEGKDATEQKIRQLEVDNYNNQIERVTNDLRAQVNTATESIDLFKSKEPAAQSAMLQALDDFEAIFVEKDDNGDYISIKVDPATGERANLQQYLQARAASVRQLMGLGAKQQAQAKQTQKKRTLTLPKREPAKKKTDPMVDAFDEVANS